MTDEQFDELTPKKIARAQERARNAHQFDWPTPGQQAPDPPSASPKPQTLTLEEFAALDGPRTLKMTSTGSGFYVSNQGHILTNEHVVNGCVEVRIPPSLLVQIVAHDETNDLAVLKSTSTKANAVAKFRQGRGIRPGDDIIVVGFPLHGLLTSDPSVTKGNVSALAGPGDDRRYVQITAPVQQGNSGGPLLGHL